MHMHVPCLHVVHDDTACGAECSYSNLDIASQISTEHSINSSLAGSTWVNGSTSAKGMAEF